MKVLISLIVVLLVALSSANADYCITHQDHTDSYYYGGVVTPEVDRKYEVWIGGQKMVYVLEHRIVIYNLEKNILIFINKDDSTYAEAALPFEWSNILNEQDVERVMRFQIIGSVEKTKDAKRIEGRNCTAYQVHSWIPYQGTKYNETESTYWITTDVPFQLEVYKKVIATLRLFQNNTAEFTEELWKIDGYPIVVEDNRYVKGFSVKSIDRVVKVEEKDPPEGIYEPPAYCTKKEKLTMQDLRGG